MFISMQARLSGWAYFFQGLEVIDLIVGGPIVLI